MIPHALNDAQVDYMTSNGPAWDSMDIYCWMNGWASVLTMKLWLFKSATWVGGWNLACFSSLKAAIIIWIRRDSILRCWLLIHWFICWRYSVVSASLSFCQVPKGDHQYLVCNFNMLSYVVIYASHSSSRLSGLYFRRCHLVQLESGWCRGLFQVHPKSSERERRPEVEIRFQLSGENGAWETRWIRSGFCINANIGKCFHVLGCSVLNETTFTWRLLVIHCLQCTVVPYFRGSNTFSQRKICSWTILSCYEHCSKLWMFNVVRQIFDCWATCQDTSVAEEETWDCVCDDAHVPALRVWSSRAAICFMSNVAKFEKTWVATVHIASQESNDCHTKLLYVFASIVSISR